MVHLTRQRDLMVRKPCTVAAVGRLTSAATGAGDRPGYERTRRLLRTVVNGVEFPQGRTAPKRLRPVCGPGARPETARGARLRPVRPLDPRRADSLRDASSAMASASRPCAGSIARAAAS